MDILEGLNPAQREAVCHLDGPVLILAGAGSGKTRVITHRVAYLVAANHVPPHAILAVTFTNKAAGEMKDRVLKLLAAAGPFEAPLLSTFHSFCVRLLRRDGSGLAELRPGFTRLFTIYDEDDQLAAVKLVYRDLGLSDEFMPPRAALSRISFAKNQEQSPEDFYKAAVDKKAARLASVYQEYESRLRQANALDFDDLLLESVRLLRCDDVTRRAVSGRFRYLLIDEYQDTNRTQYNLMRLLSETHRNVCAVGDEDQSIYGWRGADIRNILDFERDYPDARTIRLEQNYRSTKHILDAASAVVARNQDRKGKWLWTDGDQGEPVGFLGAADGEQEALFIARAIREHISSHPEDRISVLYRTNAQSRQIEEALRRNSLKYLVVSGLSFYQRAEIKDTLAYLKVLLSPADSVSLLRIINTPARAIGRTTVEQIEKFALQNRIGLWFAMVRMLEQKLFPQRAAAALEGFRKLVEELREVAEREPVHEIIRQILARTGYRKRLEDDSALESKARLENLDELLNAAAESAERGEGVAAFLDHAALVADTDALDEAASISLLTLHNAKGLEFDLVFIAGMEEGLLPHSRVAESRMMLEEERRLCYVGMTRARKRLILTCARRRRRFGGGSLQEQQPSRFLSEVPRQLVQPLLGSGEVSQVDLRAEQRLVRDGARRNTYTGKTYNSVEHIRQFFSTRGMPASGSAPLELEPRRPFAAAAPAVPKPARGGGLAMGATIEHPRYGRGVVVRREGEGDDAKITVNFPGYGLKKIVVRYSGLKTEE